MTIFNSLTRVLAAGLLAVGLIGPQWLPSEEAPKNRPDIYDESADGAKQITQALARAKSEHKLVLLQFGANWCGWCHKLHKLFQSDAEIAGKLKDSYLVVMIDVNKGHNKETDERYQNPTRYGLPALVVLDSLGNVLVTQDSGKLEEGDHHDPKKVLAFLSQWENRK